MDDTSRAIASVYDRVCAEYARRLFDELEGKPADRDVLDDFAARVAGKGEVCDVGCGPGHIARRLRDHGADVFGLDISEGMLEEARRRNPGIVFRAGDLTALDIVDGGLAGIVAFYAIVNVPEASLPRIFGEMHRVLAPSGLLLLAFHAGREVVPVRELCGLSVELDFFFHDPDAVCALLEAAGFDIEERRVRAPYQGEYQSLRAYILARAPA